MRVQPFRLAVYSDCLQARVKGRRQMTPHANQQERWINISPLGREATLEDLYAVKGKAELVDGRLVLFPMTGGTHGNTVSNVVTSLKLYQRARGGGTPFADNVGYVLGPRDSIAPDASWHVGPWNTRSVHGAPAFAAQVRSEEDYGPAAERRMAAKRAVYFRAGTQMSMSCART